MWMLTLIFKVNKKQILLLIKLKFFSLDKKKRSKSILLFDRFFLEKLFSIS